MQLKYPCSVTRTSCILRAILHSYYTSIRIRHLFYYYYSLQSVVQPSLTEPTVAAVQWLISVSFTCSLANPSLTYWSIKLWCICISQGSVAFNLGWLASLEKGKEIDNGRERDASCSSPHRATSPLLRFILWQHASEIQSKHDDVFSTWSST